MVLDQFAHVLLAGGPPYGAARWLFDLADHPNHYLKLTSCTVEQSAGKGSDFPAHYGPISALVKAAKAALACLSETDRAAIFAGTARRLYPALAGKAD